ncbi:MULTISPECIES: EAL domain-containing protein [unclassified Halanaerobium]|uniref:EAL domain-containing protein n=1 Tax=unclassified Halanaerobium TaxID=2641197 RepID=UPI000E168E1A|nr:MULTISPECIES: EAL domain-containing protein [unclassified Halanaerobium]RCW47735.1 diguanylate cyclase (GGDEF)-like protein [Halanaerobium sp. MA284_MarDTE_T2]RCW87978.1 diguanylate cyclase (GGDEF)-like protein [Halanaerobium sp. DL-01]
MKFRNLSIKNKILFGIGLSFLAAMIFLMAAVFYQFENLSSSNEAVLEEKLLEQLYNKYQNLVRTRAIVFAEIYKNNDNLTDEEKENLIADINRNADLENNYFYIYSLEGKTISLPPTPELEGQNRMGYSIKNRYLIKEMLEVVKKGGGQVTYPYINPQTGNIETKYGYVEPIAGTDLFVGSGGYETEFNEIVGSSIKKINEVRNKTLYLSLVIFAAVTLIMFFIILDISSYFNKQVNRLISAFKEVEKGRLDLNLTYESRDEFGRLTRGFNTMLNKINNLTYNDPLTGLPNMNFLQMNLRDALENNKNSSKNLYLFTLITDNLNLINSNYGFQKGNKLLKEIYQRLNKELDNKTIIARKNDEFIFYFTSRSGREKMLSFASEILKNLSFPYEIDEVLIYIKPKIGIAKAAVPDENCSSLLKKSRIAVHFAEDKSKIAFYNRKMDGKLSGRMNLENKLRYAIKEEQFELYYQPQVDGRKNRIIGVEELIRWKHPESGLISPGDFIPLAEDTGMILELGDWILNESIKQLKIWNEKGYNDLKMSVNIAPQQFQEDDFIEKIKSILNDYDVNPAFLELEITERTAIRDVEYTIDVLNRLKKLGVSIAIDDFGTGYSSLEYLNRFAIDKLKIDKSFLHKRDNFNIVKTIIMMGQTLDLEVVAEGVETEEELDFLAANGCYLYQGYYFARPAPAEMIENNFLKNRSLNNEL